MSAPLNESWRGYHRTTGKLQWRLATPDDLPAIRRLRTVSERLLGMAPRNPALFSSPVLRTLGAENETGNVVDCIYVEAQVELVKMSCSEESLREMAGLEEDISTWLRKIGIKTVLATTIPRRKSGMARALEALGFNCADGALTYWKRHL